MINRISIKGRGGDVFFPDEEAANRPVSKEKSEVRASQHADSPATTPASDPASMQASKPASTHSENSGESVSTPPTDSQRRRLRALVLREHPVHGSYRFAQDELDALRDIVYELEVRRGITITRNDVVRLGLNSIIEDYREHGDSSQLVEVFREDEPKAGR